MEYTRLGQSGLKVSRIALGCMSFGDTSQGYDIQLTDDQVRQLEGPYTRGCPRGIEPAPDKRG
jgi:aryl-alcohol dehydrogenase-like predicted oxidoreductase